MDISPHLKELYLDEPPVDQYGAVVKIDGTPLGWTKKGAHYLHDYYTALAANAKVGSQYTQEAISHLHFTINRLKKCIAYYEGLSTPTSNGATPAAGGTNLPPGQPPDP